MAITTLEAMLGRGGPWTEDDYFDLQLDIPTHIELVDGALLVTPLASVPHQRLVRRLTNLLEETCPEVRWEAFPGLNVRLWQDHVRGPDVVVARAGLGGLKVGVPDVLLLVEVTSPSNFRQDMIVKHGDYAEAGVPFYLRVDLHKGVEAITASAYELVDGAYREFATAPDGVLALDRPWSVTADLRAMARGRS